MKTVANGIAVLVAAMVPGWVMAEAHTFAPIIGAYPIASEQLEVFKDPAAGQPSEMVDVSELKFPIKVLAEKNGYLRFSIDGESVWVRSTDVQRQAPIRPSTDKGAAASTSAPAAASAADEVPPQRQHPSGWSVPGGKSADVPVDGAKR